MNTRFEDEFESDEAEIYFTYDQGHISNSELQQQLTDLYKEGAEYDAAMGEDQDFCGRVESPTEWSFPRVMPSV